MYLDQKQQTSFILVFVHEHEGEIKRFHRIFELSFSTVGDAQGDTAHQRWLNADALYRHTS
jgi:hypothetical protein